MYSCRNGRGKLTVWISNVPAGMLENVDWKGFSAGVLAGFGALFLDRIVLFLEIGEGKDLA